MDWANWSKYKFQLNWNMLWFGVCRPRIAFIMQQKGSGLASQPWATVGRTPPRWSHPPWQKQMYNLGWHNLPIRPSISSILPSKQISYPLLLTTHSKSKSKLIIAPVLQLNFDLPAYPTLWNHEPQWHLETVVSHEFELLSPFQVDLATGQFVLKSQDMSRSSTAAVGRFHNMFPIKACSPWRNLFGSLDPQHGVFETLNSKKSQGCVVKARSNKYDVITHNISLQNHKHDTLYYI